MSGETAGLEERVAALEALALPSVSAPGTWTDEQVKEFEAAWAEAGKRPLRWMPPRPALTEAEVRQLLSECVTVVRPGEVLVLRAPEDWNPDQASQLQEYMGYWLAENAPDIKAMVIPPMEIAIMQASPASTMTEPPG